MTGDLCQDAEAALRVIEVVQVRCLPATCGTPQAGYEGISAAAEWAGGTRRHFTLSAVRALSVPVNIIDQ